MTNAWGMFLLGLFLLVLGGDSVVRGASGLGQRFGLSPFGAGLMLVAFAVSVPGLAVNGYAFAVGQPELALGNAIGSNIVNLGFTLGIAALVAPLLITMRLLAAQLVFVLVAAGAVLVFGREGSIERWQGLLLLVGFAAVLAFVFWRGRGESDAAHKQFVEFSVTSTGLVQNLIRLLMAVALLSFGSRLVVANAPTIGGTLGLDPVLTGLTVVAVGTSLPQVVTAAIAARNGHGNVVAGMVLGACLFNLLFIVGAMASLRPLAVPTSLIALALPAAMAFAVPLYPILGGDLRITRRGGAWLLFAFIVWLFVAFQFV